VSPFRWSPTSAALLWVTLNAWTPSLCLRDFLSASMQHQRRSTRHSMLLKSVLRLLSIISSTLVYRTHCQNWVSAENCFLNSELLREHSLVTNWTCYWFWQEKCSSLWPGHSYICTYVRIYIHSYIYIYIYMRSDSKVMRLIFFLLYWQHCSPPTQTAVYLDPSSIPTYSTVPL